MSSLAGLIIVTMFTLIKGAIYNKDAPTFIVTKSLCHQLCHLRRLDRSGAKPYSLFLTMYNQSNSAGYTPGLHCVSYVFK